MRIGLRAALRQATAEIHASAENQVDLRADIATAEGYQNFLRVMRSATGRFAAPLDHSSRLAGLAERSGVLLEALDRDLEDATVHRWPTGAHAAPASFDAWAIGVGYTLEGSSLGASVLQRRCPAGASTQYLDILVSARRSRWTSYSRWLDSPAVAAESTSDIVAGASAVFAAVHEAIDEFVAPVVLGVS